MSKIVFEVQHVMKPCAIMEHYRERTTTADQRIWGQLVASEETAIQIMNAKFEERFEELPLTYHQKRVNELRRDVIKGPTSKSGPGDTCEIFEVVKYMEQDPSVHFRNDDDYKAHIAQNDPHHMFKGVDLRYPHRVRVN